MDVDDLEDSHDCRGRIHEHDRAVAPARSCKREDRLQAGAVQERQLAEVEVHLICGQEVEERFSQARDGGEIELPGELQAGFVDEWRNLEYGHRFPPFTTEVN